MKTTKRICLIAVYAALIYILSMFGIPFLNSKIQLSNAVSIMGGILLGPLNGAIAAGLSDLVHDVLSGDNFFEAVLSITVKFSMAATCGLIWKANISQKLKQYSRALVSTSVGAVVYFVLHSAKHMVLTTLVEGTTVEAAWVVLLTKMPATAINAVAAIIIIPILVLPLLKALKSSHLIEN